MYISGMNHAEKVAFLRALAYFANTDGILAVEEAVTIDSVAQQLEVDLSEALDGAEELPLKELLEPISSPYYGRALVMELVRLAHADGDFCAAESSSLEQIAEILGVNAATVAAMDAWAARELEQQKLGQDIVENGR